MTFTKPPSIAYWPWTIVTASVFPFSSTPGVMRRSGPYRVSCRQSSPRVTESLTGPNSVVSEPMVTTLITDPKYKLHNIESEDVSMKKSLLPAILAVTLSIPSYADDVRRFKAEDVFELEYASDPRIAPDGSKIVYERRSNDIMTDSTRSNLWVIEPDGSGHRPLVSGTRSASSPRWSTDSGRIAYIQATDSGQGLYVRWMDTGLTALISNLRKTPSSLTWSPDGSRLAFMRADIGRLPELWVMDADGGNKRLLSRGLNGTGADHPRWVQLVVEIHSEED